ncbi:MAG: hypothetical protein LBB22_02420 [Treponema sp.]|nr:hypothetical protein [Treponema sp.]
MAKNAIYEPGELEKVKNRLGPLNEKEAKRMQKVLGGEIGVERGLEPVTSIVSDKFTRPIKGAAAGASKTAKPKRLVEIAASEDDKKLKSVLRFHRKENLSYSERVKMDTIAGYSEFKIKTFWQVLKSRLSFIGDPPDKVNPYFVKEILNECYSTLERLITAMRLLFPRSNAELSQKLRNAAPAEFKVLNTLRQWKLDTIASEIGKIQLHPRNVLVKDFENLLREIYKPLYIIGKLNDKDIMAVFQVLYDIVAEEKPNEAQAMKNKIMEVNGLYMYINTSIRRLFYPILMKIIASYYQNYEIFFIENNDNFEAFLELSEADQIAPNSLRGAAADKTRNTDVSGETGAESVVDSLSDIKDEKFEKEKKVEQSSETSETKAFERSLKILETLFPRAPWDKLGTFPDFYPYFADVLEIKKNGELIAPEDPLQLALILSQIIEELLYAFRYIKFIGQFAGESSMISIVDDWHTAISESFEKKYLIRVSEYSHYFENSLQKRNSTYAVNISTDIHWIRRYYFLPNYDTIPPTPPSFFKKDVVAIYTLAHRLRKDLTACAVAIDAANKLGGAAENALVEGIENPWEPYNFQVENPLSKRLNMLLGKKQHINASLIFFTLAAVTVLDNYLSDKASIAYTANNEIFFRHSGHEEMKPVFWVEKQTGTFDIFKKSIESLKKKK